MGDSFKSDKAYELSMKGHEAFDREDYQEAFWCWTTAQKWFQKEHYGLKRINGRIKKTEILIIFFGIHTANAVQLAKRTAEAELCLAA